MITTTLTPLSGKDIPFDFLGKKPIVEPQKRRYKIYHDGGHYVASLLSHTTAYRPSKSKGNRREDIDILFDSLYINGLGSGLKGQELTNYIASGILKLFPSMVNLNGYIEKKMERKAYNLYVRKKRFRRKANLNPWTHFVTITYDDKKQDENSFRKKLRKCFSNLHTRRGWRYMGVFERAPETNRLHFHGIFYIPDGEMIGTLTERKDYSKEKGAMQLTIENSFFAKSFGRNDFKGLNEMELKSGSALTYITKYIGKTNERIVYSRAIPSEICKELPDSDIAAEFFDFVPKMVLFDDVIDWERDIAKLRYTKQMTFVDLLCNPPRK